VLALLSVVLGWLQYTTIEQTFRYEGRNSLPMSKFAAIVVGLAALLIVPSAAILNMDGWKGRIPAARETLTNRELRNKERKTYCSSVDPEKPKDLFTCQNYRGKDRDIILWGDSHALHLVAGFSEVYPDYNIFVLYLSGCVPQSGFGSFIHGLPVATLPRGAVYEIKKPSRISGLPSQAQLFCRARSAANPKSSPRRRWTFSLS